MNDKDEECKTKNPINPKPEFFDKKRLVSKFPNNKSNEIDDMELEEDTQSDSDDDSTSSEDSDSNVKSHANMSMRQV